ncbi:hypothetical protein LIA77_03568 [Sarocladium implicatum]|nr:hypothetical protein LIA77_03568 [Sarocladium implicatum]
MSARGSCLSPPCSTLELSGEHWGQKAYASDTTLLITVLFRGSRLWPIVASDHSQRSTMYTSPSEQSASDTFTAACRHELNTPLPETHYYSQWKHRSAPPY